MLEKFSSLQSKNFNKTLLERLSVDGVWKISEDEQTHNIKSSKSDAGFLFITYFDKPFTQDGFFNTAAEIIFDSVITNSKSDWYDIVIKRFNYNYYNQSSDGVLHKDHDSENMFSIVYNINSNDGGTIIEDDFYLSHEGSAVLFNSNKLHRGAGPKEYKKRFMLNIVFSGRYYNAY